MTDLILGTAGHIDHGKTALVRALTGTDTDRLPEEKRRGITIELGFARLPLGEFQLGIVDVPGHERFVRQMLAGATGMDLAMLVVAADDSVKPQTREHVDVLRMLDLRGGVIVLTKCDLADRDWIELVAAEVRELVADTFLSQAPVICTSAVTGEGIEELKSALAAAARVAAASLDAAVHRGPFRMAIDRAFTLPGHGTIVTGSVASGHVRVGDELVVQPGDIRVRVRSLQRHDEAVECLSRGQRAAMNVAGIHHGDILRGHELAAVGHLVSSQLVTAEIGLLPTAARPLKSRDQVRVHVGTAESLATVSLLEGNRLSAGQRGLAQLFLREPIAAVWNQPLVLRSESPVATIGGGHILVPVAGKLRRPSPERLRTLRELTSPDERVRAAAALFWLGLQPWQDADLLRLAGMVQPAEIVRQLVERGTLRPLVVSPTRVARLESRLIEDWTARICRRLKTLHEAEPLRSHLDRSRLLNFFSYVDDAPLLEALLAELAAAGVIRMAEGQVALAEHKPILSPRQQEMFVEIERRFAQARFQPPALAECYDLHPQQPAEIDKLVRLAASDGRLVHVGQGMYLHRDMVTEMHNRLREALRDGSAMTLSQIRELLETTRKYAVPLCEYLDRTGFTKRKGDVRVLA